MKRIAAIPLALLATLTVPPAGAGGFDRWSDAAHYEFEYRIDLDSVNMGDGQHGRLWIPMPADTLDQKVLSVSVESPLPHREQRDALGNRIATIDWEGRPPRGEIIFRVKQQGDAELAERRMKEGEAFRAGCRSRDLLMNPVSEGRFRAVTHLDVSEADIDDALGRIAETGVR